MEDNFELEEGSLEDFDLNFEGEIDQLLEENVDEGNLLDEGVEFNVNDEEEIDIELDLNEEDLEKFGLDIGDLEKEIDDIGGGVDLSNIEANIDLSEEEDVIVPCRKCRQQLTLSNFSEHNCVVAGQEENGENTEQSEIWEKEEKEEIKRETVKERENLSIAKIHPKKKEEPYESMKSILEESMEIEEDVKYLIRSLGSNKSTKTPPPVPPPRQGKAPTVRNEEKRSKVVRSTNSEPLVSPESERQQRPKTGKTGWQKISSTRPPSKAITAKMVPKFALGSLRRGQAGKSGDLKNSGEDSMPGYGAAGRGASRGLSTSSSPLSPTHKAASTSSFLSQSVDLTSPRDEMIPRERKNMSTDDSKFYVLPKPSRSNPKATTSPKNTSSSLQMSEITPPTSPKSASDAPKKIERRVLIVKELIQTEGTYLDALSDMVKMKKLMVLHNIPHNVLLSTFLNAEVLKKIHEALLDDLNGMLSSSSDDPVIGGAISNLAPYMKMYTPYVNGYDEGTEVITRQYQKNPTYAELIDQIKFGASSGVNALMSIRITPIQRIPRQALLKNFI